MPQKRGRKKIMPTVVGPVIEVRGVKRQTYIDPYGRGQRFRINRIVQFLVDHYGGFDKVFRTKWTKRHWTELEMREVARLWGMTVNEYARVFRDPIVNPMWNFNTEPEGRLNDGSWEPKNACEPAEVETHEIGNGWFPVEEKPNVKKDIDKDTEGVVESVKDSKEDIDPGNHDKVQENKYKESLDILGKGSGLTDDDLKGV